jgi:serine/threonine protein kinase/DNA-binding NarL/FixJ family response regulator
MSRQQGPVSPPQRLQDRYSLVEPLGEGSMGLVYRAHDETLDRDVAVKFLRPERVAGGQASARFVREARAVARLSHPNIMTLYDVGREAEWHYLVLEHIPGLDLHTAMVERGGPLPLCEAVHVIRGALEALAYAHDRDIVHRDVKPENIMITPDGQVKVTDFGLALARSDVRVTQEDTIVGTVLYLAPEMIAGQPTDRRADLYAIGAVMYELLTGRPPFVGDDPLAVFSLVLNAPLTSPRVLDPSIPTAVEQVILRLLAKDPDERFASAHEVLTALPSAQEMEELAAETTDQIVAQRSTLTLLERIVRSSSTSESKGVVPVDADEEPLLALPGGVDADAPDLAAELLVYAASEDTSAAVEAERRRLAELLQGNVIDPLNLLLSQANAYAQSLGTNPTVRMAVSVLSSLAQQAMQRARDLEANLRPAILETLGLEPALESLASQTMRAHGLQVSLSLERMRERLPRQIELALFRAAQDALERAVQHAHASQVTIRLERDEERVVLSMSDNGTGAVDYRNPSSFETLVPARRRSPTGGSAGDSGLLASLQRIEQLGGTVGSGISPFGGLELTITFVLAAPVELTPREMEVIQLLTEGLSNKEIARILSISPRTVNFHLDNIYSKLGVNSRTEAAIHALRHGWVRRTGQ